MFRELQKKGKEFNDGIYTNYGDRIKKYLSDNVEDFSFCLGVIASTDGVIVVYSTKMRGLRVTEITEKQLCKEE